MNRLSLNTDLSQVVDYFKVNEVIDTYEKAQSVEPKGQVFAVSNHQGKRCLHQSRWGFMPFWAKDSIITNRDYVFEKNAFQRLSVNNRCVIPCSGYYEVKIDGKEQVFYHIELLDQEVFGIAAIYDIWRNHYGEKFHTISIITTKPNQLVHELKEYMPVILEEKAMECWLDAEIKDKHFLQNQLASYDPTKMKVSTSERIVH